jgi:glycosyltransferase involved in cell wall biosynthesis
MRVLWFCHTSSLAGKSKGSGNWIASLEEEIRKKVGINLYIAFHENGITTFEEINDGIVTYFKLPSRLKTKVHNILTYWKLIPDILSNWKQILLPHLTSETGNEVETHHYLEIIRKVNPDIIQIFGFENNFVRIISKTNVPVIIHIQGICNIVMNYLLGNFKEKELRPLTYKNILTGDAFMHIYKYFYDMALVEKEAYRNCRYYFGRTDMDRRAVLLFSPKAKYFHCDELMRKEFYEVRWNKERTDIFKIYTTLFDLPYKGTDQIFLVSELLKEYHPELNFEWNIAGLSEDSITVKAMRRRGFTKTPQLRFLGNLRADEIICQMKIADIFVYPSFIENGCNAVQEAMLLGMPIVCTSSGGMSTTIKNYETGLLVQHGDPYSMAGAIIELLNDSGLAKKMGDNAREVAQIRHNREKIVLDVISTYNKILSEK